MAIESDDEARRAAEATIADVGSGEIERAADFFSIYSEPRDAHRVWSFMLPMLNEAVGRLRSGDDSSETARLAAFAMDSIEQFAIADAERAAAKAERVAERRAATLMAIQPPPDIAHRMTDVGLHGIPLPDDAVPDGSFLATSHASPAGLDVVLHQAHAGGRMDARPGPLPPARRRAELLLHSPGPRGSLRLDPDRTGSRGRRAHSIADN